MMSWIAMALSVAASFPNIQSYNVTKVCYGRYIPTKGYTGSCSEWTFVGRLIPTNFCFCESFATNVHGIYRYIPVWYMLTSSRSMDGWWCSLWWYDVRGVLCICTHTHLLIRKKGLASDRHTVCGSVIIIVRKGQIRYRYCRYLLSSGNVDPIDIGRTCHHRTLLYSKYVILVSIHDIENDPQ